MEFSNIHSLLEPHQQVKYKFQFLSAQDPLIECSKVHFVPSPHLPIYDHGRKFPVWFNFIFIVQRLQSVGYELDLFQYWLKCEGSSSKIPACTSLMKCLQLTIFTNKYFTTIVRISPVRECLNINVCCQNKSLSSLFAEQQAVGILRWELMWLISTASLPPTSPPWPLYPLTLTKPEPEERALQVRA